MSKLKGNNEIHLNLATMCMAIQHYLNTQVLSSAAAVEVSSVVSLLNGSEFRIDIKPRSKPDPEDPTR